VTAAAPSSPLNPRDYRHAVGRFATGVTVVSTAWAGVRYGMTVNSFTSLSLDPLLVLFCCERDASLHGPLLSSGEWGVSVLGAEQQEQAAWFATRGGAGVDQFTDRSVTRGPVTGSPLLHDALAWLECRTWATYDGGDHTIVVGEVVHLALGKDEPPLLYFRSTYRTVAED
jgi:flavin reductase (DIM6/NTAB) family NADH-FMN oxidoreductase RutF